MQLYGCATAWELDRALRKAVEARAAADVSPEAAGGDAAAAAEAAAARAAEELGAQHGALELVSAARGTPNAASWHKLYDLLEEQYAVRTDGPSYHHVMSCHLILSHAISSHHHHHYVTPSGAR